MESRNGRGATRPGTDMAEQERNGPGEECLALGQRVRAEGLCRGGHFWAPWTPARTGNLRTNAFCFDAFPIVDLGHNHFIPRLCPSPSWNIFDRPLPNARGKAVLHWSPM